MSKKTNTDTTVVTSLSPYERRVRMVIDTIQLTENMSDKSAKTLAVAVLHVLDHIPERVR
jgi:hypothetical protein